MLNEEARRKILNLPVDTNKRFEDIENLKDVPNTPYMADTGECTIENSKKGYLTNFNIQGKTLVNLASTNMFTLENNSTKEGNFIKLNNSASYVDLTNRLNTGIYTLIVNVSDINVSYTIHTILSGGGNKEVFAKSGNQVLKLNMDENVTKLRVYTKDLSNTLNIQMILLEGDYTNTYIDYFEGLQSVGQGNNIKLFSCKEDNIIPNDITWKDGYYLSIIDNLEYESANYSYTLDYIPVKADTNYTLVYANWNILFYDKDKNRINFAEPKPFININGLNKISEGVFFIKTPPNSCYMGISVTTRYKDRLTISEGTKFDEKLIPYTLRSLPDSTRDEIIYKDGCYKLIQRCEELVLDGQSFWSEFTANSNDVTLLFKNPIGKSQSNNTNLYCDVFKSTVIFDATNTVEGVYETSNNVWIRIFKNRLATQNLEGFNSWLNNNKVTLVRPLKEHKEIDISSINLEQYDNQTKFICNSNVIPSIGFERTRNLGSQIDVIKSSIKNINHIQSSPRIMDLSNKLLNGWKRTVSDNGGFIISKNGNQVSFHMRIIGGATTDGTALLKLPNGFIPKTFYVFPIFTTQSNQLVQGFIFFNFDNGYLQITQLSSNVDVYSYGTYFIE